MSILSKRLIPVMAIGLVGCAGLSGSADAQDAGDVERGADIAYTCLGCHGIPDYQNVYPTYHVPKLGGQNAQYIVDALKAYASGDRKHGTMNGQAGSLSEQDMKDVAAYFEQRGKNEDAQ